jgi:hypothetical protein
MDTEHMAANVKVDGRAYSNSNATRDRDDSQMQTEHKSPTTTDTKLRNGCLFMCCIQCACVDIVVFNGGIIPALPIPSAARYLNGVVMITCGGCETRATRLDIDRSSFQSRCIGSFQLLKLNKDLLKSADVLTIANLITGKNVNIMTHKGGILYMARERILEHVTGLDRMMSLRMDAPLSDSNHTLPYLRGGFF